MRQACRGDQRQASRALRLAAFVDTDDDHLRKAAGLDGVGGQQDDALKRGQVQVHHRLARFAAAVDRARFRLLHAGRHHDRDLDVPLPVGHGRPEGFAPATRIVTLAPLMVWNGNTVDPSSPTRVQPCTRCAPLPSSNASTATRGIRSAGAT